MDEAKRIPETKTFGILALVGGAEWQPGCEFDGELLARSGGEVLVLPTAAAYERPDRAVDTASKWFESLGGKARGLMVLTRTDAESEENAQAVSAAKFIYLSGGSVFHLKSVLKDSKVWSALVSAWRAGATIAGSSAGAMVLVDPMIDPRGGAFTLGLGLLPKMAFYPHFDHDAPSKLHRTFEMAPSDLPIACIEEKTAIIREPNGNWKVEGDGKAVVYLNGKLAGLGDLP